MKYVSIDPGLSTGLAVRLKNGDFWTDTVRGSEDTFKRIVHMLDSHSPEAVVIETFLGIQRMSAFGIETIELIGAIKGQCVLRNVPIHRQTPAYRKMAEREATAMLDTRMLALNAASAAAPGGTKLFGYTDHEVSSLAHLLMFERALAKRIGSDSAARAMVGTWT